MRPVGVVDVRMMRFSQMIGVECPIPCSLHFHLRFSFSLHDVGGFAFGASPVPRGPRHWCQLWRVWARQKGGSRIRKRVVMKDLLIVDGL